MEDAVRKLIVKEYCVIFDVGYPMELNILEKITDAFLNVVSVLCFTEDCTLQTKMSLYVINSDFRAVTNSLPLKGNFSKISNSLVEIKRIATVSGRPEEHFKDFILVSLNTAVKCLKESTKDETMWARETALEVFLITQKNVNQIEEELMALFNVQSLAQISKITVMEVNEAVNIYSSRKHLKTTFEFHRLPNAQHLMENLLKNQFLPAEYDKEDLQLVLPEATIKCDVHENMIRTELIPYGGKMQMCSSFLGAKFFRSEKDALLQDSIEIFKLAAINRVSREGVCESHIFGAPMKVFPARCRVEALKKTYEENRQKFAALCAFLCKREEYLILKRLGSEPTGHFLLIPSNNMFLLKCLVSNELLLPSKSQEFVSLSNPNVYIMSQITKSLNDLPSVEEYEPLENNCGLYRALRHLPSSEKPAKGNSKKSSSPSPTLWTHFSPPCSELKPTNERSSKKKKLQTTSEQLLNSYKTTFKQD